MLVSHLLLFGTWAAVRATTEARHWLTSLQSAGLAWLACLRIAAAKPNAVLNKISVAKRSSPKAKMILAEKAPGSNT